MRKLILVIATLTMSNAGIADCAYTHTCDESKGSMELLFMNKTVVETDCVYEKENVIAYEVKDTDETIVWFNPIPHQTVLFLKPANCKHDLSYVTELAQQKQKEWGTNYIMFKDSDLNTPAETENEYLVVSDAGSLSEDVKRYIRYVYIDNFLNHTDEMMLSFINKNYGSNSNVYIRNYYYSVKEQLRNSLCNDRQITTRTNNVQQSGYRQKVGKVIIDTLFGTGKQDDSDFPPLGSPTDYETQADYQNAILKRMLGKNWSPLGHLVK